MGGEATKESGQPAGSHPQSDLSAEQQIEALTADFADAGAVTPGTEQPSETNEIQPTAEEAQAAQEAEAAQAAEAAAAEEAAQAEAAAKAAEEAAQAAGQETERKSPAQERIEELAGEKNRLKHELESTRAQLQEWDKVNASAIPLPRSYVSPAEAKAIEQANQQDTREEWLLENVGTGGVDPVSGKELSVADIGRELAGLVKTRAWRANVRAMYDQKLAQFVADAEAGRKARAEASQVQSPTSQAPGPKSKVQSPAAPAKAPVKPGAAVKPPAAPAGRPVAAPTKARGVDWKTFEQNKELYGEQEAQRMALAAV